MRNIQELLKYALGEMKKTGRNSIIITELFPKNNSDTYDFLLQDTTTKRASFLKISLSYRNDGLFFGISFENTHHSAQDDDQLFFEQEDFQNFLKENDLNFDYESIRYAFEKNLTGDIKDIGGCGE